MPKGFAGVRKAAKEQAERRAAGGTMYFRLPNDGDTAIVRFLEEGDDVAWCYMHEVPVENRKWGEDVPCLDQEKEGLDCPGCDADLPRRVKGYINVIWHDAPKFKRDDKGKIVKDSTGDPVVIGKEPAVALWSSGIRLMEELDEIDENFKGLRSRKFKVKRKGSGLQTTYSITPEDIDSGPQKFTEKEVELEAKKQDTTKLVTPPSYEDFTKKMNGQATSSNGNGGSQADPAEAAKSRNPFMRNK